MEIHGHRWKDDLPRPDKVMPVTSLDLDLTNDCVLRCDYCFKGGKNRKSMSLETAKRAVDWLIEVSGTNDSLNIIFFGGEPLMKFDLIKRIVPYGVLRAQHKKRIYFGITTNIVLVTPEVIDFFSKYGISFHSSIDGIPEVQDRHRKFPDGTGSSHIVEKKVKLILDYWPNCMARATFAADTVEYLYQNLLYFVELGYIRVGFAPAVPEGWSDDKFDILQCELRKIGDFYIENLRKGKRYKIGFIDHVLEKLPLGRNASKSHCGAGRGSLSVDTEGHLWPCHRFSGVRRHCQWIIGSVYGGFDNELRDVFLSLNTEEDTEAECERCQAAPYFCTIPCVAGNWEDNRNIYEPHKNVCRIYRMMSKESKRVFDILKAENNELLMNGLSTKANTSGDIGASESDVNGKELSLSRNTSCTPSGCFV